MKLTLNDIQYLKEPILVISDLVNEATFKVDKDKIELIAMDPANVAMVVFRLLSTAFSEYNVNDKEELSLNLDSLKQILRRAKPEDILTLELIDNKFTFVMSSIAAEGLSEEWLNTIITEKEISMLTSIKGINAAGEGGEFESLVLDCPLFQKRIELVKVEKVMEKRNTGRLVIKEAKLTFK